MAQGRHSKAGVRGSLMVDRRRALMLATGALGVAGFAAVVGCMNTGSSPAASGADGTETPAPVVPASATLAHQAATSDGDSVFYVDFSEGSLVRCDAHGQGRTVLYSNGQINHLGIRYLVCASGEVFFCDAPTASLLAVPQGGGEARTVWASPNTDQLPLPLCVDDGRIYVSLLDSTTMTSTILSVAPDGSEVRRHTTLPAGFYAQVVDGAEGRVYYAGVADGDTRQIRSMTLDGTDEQVLFSLDGVASKNSALSWQVSADRLLVEVQDDAAGSNRLLSLALDGTDEQLVYDFSSQKVLFDLYGSDLWFVNRETFSLMARADEGGPLVEEVATLPKRASGTAVSFLEAGEGVAWVTTVTAGEDTANEYVTYMVSRETGEVIELS